MAIKKSSLISIGGYLGGFQSEDYDLWIRMARRNMTFINCDIVTLQYRISETQSKGSRLAYSESASYSLREFLLTKKIPWLLSTIINVSKVFLFSKR